MPSFFRISDSVTQYLIIFIAVLLLILDPLHTFLADMLGIPTYTPLVLFGFLLVFYQSVRGNLDYGSLIDIRIAFILLVAIGIFAFLLTRFEAVVGVKRIFGSVIAPFSFGVFLALMKNKNQVIRYFGVVQFMKILMLLFLAEAYFLGYPKRPEFLGEAMYLLFGMALDAAVGLLIVVISSVRFPLNAAAWLLVPLLALNIVGLNSRAMLVSSLLIAFLAVCFQRSRRKAALLAFLVYVGALFATLFLLPGRVEHWQALIGTLQSWFGFGSYQGYVDTSTLIRLESVFGGQKLNLFEDSHTADRNLITSHFLFSTLYSAGFTCFVLFLVLWCGVIWKSIGLIRNTHVVLKIVGFFGFSAALNVLYFGLLFNSQIVFLLFGFVLVYPVAKNGNFYPSQSLVGDGRECDGLRSSFREKAIDRALP